MRFYYDRRGRYAGASVGPELPAAFILLRAVVVACLLFWPLAVFHGWLDLVELPWFSLVVFLWCAVRNVGHLVPDDRPAAPAPPPAAHGRHQRPGPGPRDWEPSDDDGRRTF